MRENKKKPCCGKHNNCAESIDSNCIALEMEVPQWSGLNSKQCVTLEDVIEDIYDVLTEIRKSIDLKDLGAYCKECIDYGVEDREDLTVNRVLYALERKICSME